MLHTLVISRLCPCLQLLVIFFTLPLHGCYYYYVFIFSAVSLVIFCIHFLCGINKYCFLRAYILSFLHSFPTYPRGILTVVTAVVYMAIQTDNCYRYSILIITDGTSDTVGEHRHSLRGTEGRGQIPSQIPLPPTTYSACRAGRFAPGLSGARTVPYV